MISLYNEHCFTEGGFIAPMALMAAPEDKVLKRMYRMQKSREGLSTAD